MAFDLTEPWWKRGVVYQIYPWSFQDSNGDGVGDLNGVRRRLEYLAWLGVDAIWLSPVYPSPMADFGYDVSDYRNIDPRFGTLEDFDALVDDAHRLGLKVILDFVPNHTSDQHPWFIESRSARDNAFRNFYIWRDAAPGGGPPTNWLSEFGGSAWKWDEATQQYYYHAYLEQQPDLNHRNPIVERELSDVLRFWLSRNVDGFRIDTIHHLIKDDQYRNNPANEAFVAGMPPHRSLVREFTTDRPEVLEAIARMRLVADEFPDRVLIGEAYLPFERLVRYYGADLRGLHLPFNFHLMAASWDARSIQALIERYERVLPPGAWPNWVLGNHDKSRIATRLGRTQARVAALLLLTLRGTPTLYYGDELGMQDVRIPPDQVRDPFEKNVPGIGVGRDPERTPMQWSGELNAGFTGGVPWLPVAADYPSTNVAAQAADPNSMLSLYRRILALRRREPALSLGDYASIAAEEGFLAYKRRYGRRELVVLLNLTDEAQVLRHVGTTALGELLLSTDANRPLGTVSERAELAAGEGVVIAHTADA
jgi:alpha-glucosidase